MLEIKQKHHVALPHIQFSSQPMQFAPVTDDGDELTQAIQEDPASHDDDWQLEERPDTSTLEEYWETVETDVKNDPKWFNFATDDE